MHPPFYPQGDALPIKTHIQRPKCELRVRELADYMSCSQQSRITYLRNIKYRRIAQQLNHKEARLTIAKWLREAAPDVNDLQAIGTFIRNRMTTTNFEIEQNETNADYIDAFIEAFPKMNIPACELHPSKPQARIKLNGTDIVYNPDLHVRRVTKVNTIKEGAVFLRYAKGKELSEEAALFQSSFAYKFLEDAPFEETAKPENKLCMTVDGYTGKITEAPGDSVYRFKEMKATCATISAMWPTLEPPPNAVL